jgi:hypothetical protein
MIGVLEAECDMVRVRHEPLYDFCANLIDRGPH